MCVTTTLNAGGMTMSTERNPTNLLRRTLLFKICCIASALWFPYIIFNQVSQSSHVDEAFTKEAIELISKDSKYVTLYKKSRLQDLKYILLWDDGDYSPFQHAFQGQRDFMEANCSFVNCYTTSDSTLLGDITKFDGIAFNGRKIAQGERSWVPSKRSPHQKYIFFNLESDVNYPVCSKKFDGFFNWTATYKLDSDIPWTYVLIKDKLGNVVGPKKDMIWEEYKSNDLDNQMFHKIHNKTKAAAWFVSNCNSKSNREQFVKRLQAALKPYGLDVDVYGQCGKLSCPRNQHKSCMDLLKQQYYFYMSLENSFSEDYVTEKLLTAVNNYVVPVVFGGADYSRFLPPASYINGKEYNSTYLAHLINELMNSPEHYSKYFRWRDHYRYVEGPDLCEICAALNNRTMVETKSTYNNFRSWWYPKYKNACS